MTTTRVAILDCDDTVPEVAPTYGARYSDIFITLLQAAAQRIPNLPEVTFSAYDPRVGHFPDPNTVDAILVTGGIVGVNDPLPWIPQLCQFIKGVYEQHPEVRIFGACLGHQMVSYALLRDHGVAVEVNPKGYQFGVRSIQLNPHYTTSFPENARKLKELKMQVAHGDHVRLPSTPLPIGWVSVGSTDCCDIHGLYLPDRVLTLQGHFELNEEICYKSIKYFFTPEKGYTPEFIEAALASTKGEDDSLLIAELVLDFLIGGSKTRSLLPASV